MDYDVNFTLDRIYTYEILPQRNSLGISVPEGGAFKADAEFKSQLQSYLKQFSLNDRTRIEFRSATFSAEPRENPVRSLILDFCFGSTAAAKKASVDLATKLSRAMDQRSPTTLLVLVSYKSKIDSDVRRMAMWTLTSDKSIQFSVENGFARLLTHSDTFSFSSTFNKGVLYEGRQDKSSFVQGYVVDRQSSMPPANYWVSDFLDSGYAIEQEQDKYSRVYISAAPLDFNAVQIYEALQSEDFHPYFASREVGLGKAWLRESRMMMRDASFVIICVSDESIYAEYQGDEIDMALSLSAKDPEKLIIPIRTADVKFPKLLAGFRGLEMDEMARTKSLRQLLHLLKTHEKELIESRVNVDTDSMYVRSLRLKNIRCFSSLEMNFIDGNSTSLWNMFLGDNGAGKTTILRCLALGLTNERDATALMADSMGSFVRKGEEFGEIEIELGGPGSTRGVKLLTRIESLPTNQGTTEIVRKTMTPPLEHLDGSIFVAAYGTQRTQVAHGGASRYSPKSAVDTLFDPNATLLNPEVVILRQPVSIRHRIEKRLLSILLLDDLREEFNYGDTGLAIRGPWGTFPLNELSDGFRCTSQWVLDLLGNLLLANRLYEDSTSSGVVIVDELEQHLHPKWQRLIVHRLRQQFPKLQFFTTTHTPLIASGITDLESATLFRLDLDARNGEAVDSELNRKDYEGIRADQWLASDAFGLTTTRSPGSSNEIDRYIELLRASQDNEELLVELSALRAKLRDRLSYGESAYEREVASAVTEVLERRLKDKPAEPFSELAKQQLRDLFQRKGE